VNLRTVVTVAIICMVAAIASAADTTPRLDFALEDQFGVSHTDEDCDGQVVILMGGDRKGVEHVNDWGPALHHAISRWLADGQVCSVGFAHLKGAPFFVRKKIVESFPTDPDRWTLLDWKGHIRKSWGGEKHAANLYLFDREGRLVLQDPLREFDEERLDRIVTEIGGLIGDPDADPS
jgi:hypothetical protein